MAYQCECKYVDNIEDLKKEAEKLIRVLSPSFALIYMFSELIFQKVQDFEMDKIAWEECTEARFFGESAELKILRNDEGNYSLYVTKDIEDDDSKAIVRYRLAPRFTHMGDMLELVEYYEEDEDGQSVIKKNRLRQIVRGERRDK